MGQGTQTASECLNLLFCLVEKANRPRNYVRLSLAWAHMVRHGEVITSPPLGSSSALYDAVQQSRDDRLTRMPHNSNLRSSGFP